MVKVKKMVMEIRDRRGKEIHAFAFFALLPFGLLGDVFFIFCFGTSFRGEISIAGFGRNGR